QAEHPLRASSCGLVGVLRGVVLAIASFLVAVCCRVSLGGAAGRGRRGLLAAVVRTHRHLDVAAVLTRDADNADRGVDLDATLAADVDAGEGCLDRDAGAVRLRWG